MSHQSVLLKEAIEALALKANGIYIDGTFGRGGHSAAILAALSEQGRLFTLDKDQAAIAHAKARFSDDPRFHIMQGSFKGLAEFSKNNNIFGKIDGILLDLGLSSPQLDEAQRGFSFLHEGPLDMRMDQTTRKSAQHFIQEADVETMAKVFRNYGEERYALRIARAIDRARAEEPIQTTTALAEIVKAAHPRWEKHKHPATRVFQAIRIYINQELEDLEAGLEAALASLAIGGRLVVISFHSLEDRAVKHFMRFHEQGETMALQRFLPVSKNDSVFKRIGKAIKPSTEEVEKNPRARSAILRVGEKLK